jgi:hypothetical protein
LEPETSELGKTDSSGDPSRLAGTAPPGLSKDKTRGQCGGHPCVRGMRIRVTDILEMLANFLSATFNHEKHRALLSGKITPPAQRIAILDYLPRRKARYINSEQLY